MPRKAGSSTSSAATRGRAKKPSRLSTGQRRQTTKRQRVVQPARVVATQARLMRATKACSRSTALLMQDACGWGNHCSIPSSTCAWHTTYFSTMQGGGLGVVARRQGSRGNG